MRRSQPTIIDLLKRYTLTWETLTGVLCVVADLHGHVGGEIGKILLDIAPQLCGEIQANVGNDPILLQATQELMMVPVVVAYTKRTTHTDTFAALADLAYECGFNDMIVADVYSDNDFREPNHCLGDITDCYNRFTSLTTPIGAFTVLTQHSIYTYQNKLGG